MFKFLITFIYRKIQAQSQKILRPPRFLEFFSEPNSERNADKTDRDTRKKIKKSRRKTAFFNQFPDFEFKRRKSRERAQKSDKDCQPQIFVYLKFFGQQNS